MVIDHERQLRNLLAGDRRSRSRRGEARRRIGAEPEVYLPIACKLAEDEMPEVAVPAAALLEDYLGSNQPLDILWLALGNLPARCLALASVAARVTEGISSALRGGQGVPAELAAELCNHLSVKLAEKGEFQRAQNWAREAVERFRKLSEGNRHLRTGLVLALNTLANQLAAAGDAWAAVETALEAVKIAKELTPKSAKQHRVVLGRSLTHLSNRLMGVGQHGEALRIGLRALKALPRCSRAEPSVAADFALARLAIANALNNSGRFGDAVGYAKAAHSAFGPLAAKNPGEFWECLLAAANALSVALSRTGRFREASTVVGRSLRRFDALADRYPHAYGAEFVMYLVTHSVSLADAGDRVRASEAAKLATKKARRLRSVAGVDAFLIEGQTLNNLFNRLFEADDFAGALKTANSAVRLLRRSHAHSPEASEDLVTALRNLAEAKRMTSRTPSACRRAAAAAEVAVRTSDCLRSRDSLTTKQLIAQCHSTLAQCLFELGQLDGAIASETLALGIRRKLFAAEPEPFRRNLAFSLRLIAESEASAGRPVEALRHIAESIRCYRGVGEGSEEDLRQHEAEALRIRAIILGSLGLRMGAVRTYRAAWDLLKALDDEHHEGARAHLIRVLGEYTELRSTIGLEPEPDIVAWVNGQPHQG